MTVNLRLSLTVFKIGFAAESASGFAALASTSGQLPFHGLLILLNPAFTALGILFLWIGRHEWNELHHARVGHANLAFAVTIAASAVAAVPIGYLSLSGAPTPPFWLNLTFGVAVAFLFAMSFVTYALVSAHLTGRLGEVAMGLGLGWAIVLSAGIGLVLTPQLHPIVVTVLARSTNVGAILDPINLLDGLLAFSYLAFFLAFTDAHYRVARGLDPPDGDVEPASGAEGRPP